MSAASVPPPDLQAYSGDVSAEETWQRLRAQGGAQLVDVRTVAEWRYVGVPDLSSLSREALLVEWQSYPELKRNPQFVAETAAALQRAGYEKGAAIFFICRSGARSRAAAIAMTEAGYGPCFNVGDGFEGKLDGTRHRGKEGWKASGLPWVQS